MNDFHSLWYWLTDIAQNSRAAVPLIIHSRSGDREGWEWDEDADPLNVIRSMPFSKSFLRRVDHELPRSIREALESMKPVSQDAFAIRRARKAQWRVVSSVLKNGETDTEACRLRLGMSDYQFRVAAVSGILALRSALDREA